MGGLFEKASTICSEVCPCSTQYPTQYSPLVFIGYDYYCESGNLIYTCRWYPSTLHVYPNDPLWDGKQCSVQETTCCNSALMPSFITT